MAMFMHLSGLQLPSSVPHWRFLQAWRFAGSWQDNVPDLILGYAIPPNYPPPPFTLIAAVAFILVQIFSISERLGSESRKIIITETPSSTPGVSQDRRPVRKGAFPSLCVPTPACLILLSSGERTL